MRNSLKRWTALLLALVMAASLLPTVSLPASAQQDTVGTLDHTDIISLPITIRNHATDGMLFEWDGIGSGEYEYKPFRNPYNTSDVTEPIPYIGANPAVGQLFCNDWDVSNLNKNGIQYHYGETYDSRYAHIAPESSGWHDYDVWTRRVDNHLDTQYMVIRFRSSDFGNDKLYIKRYTSASEFKQAELDLHTDSASGGYKLVGTENGWTTFAVDLNDSSVQKTGDHDGTPASAITKISIGFNGNHSLDISIIAFFMHLENNGNYDNSFRYCAYDFINQDYCFRMNEPVITMVDPIPAAGLNVLTSRLSANVTVTGAGASVVNHSTNNTGPAYDSDKYVTVTAGSEAAQATVWSGDAYTGRYIAIRCSNVDQDLYFLINGARADRAPFNPATAQEGSDGVLERKTEGSWVTLIYDLGTAVNATSLGLEIPAGASVDLAYLGIFRDYSLVLTTGYNYATDAHVFVFEDYSYRHDRIAYNANVEQYQVYKDGDKIRFKQWNGSSYVNFDPTVSINLEYPYTINGTKADLNHTAVNGDGEEVSGTWKYYKLTDTANERGIGARQILLNGVNRNANDLRYVVVSYCVTNKGSATGDTVPMYVMLDTADSGFDYTKLTLGFFDAVADGRWHVDTLDLSECVSRAPNGETYSYKHDTFTNNVNIKRIGLADGWAVYGLEFQLAYMTFFSTKEAADQYGNAYSEGNKRFNFNTLSTPAAENTYSVITNAFTAQTGQVKDDANLVKHLDGNQNNWNASNLEYWENDNGSKKFRAGSNNGFELLDPDYAYNNYNDYHANNNGIDGNGRKVPNYYKDMGFGEWIRNDGGYSSEIKNLYKNYNTGPNGEIGYYNDPIYNNNGDITDNRTLSFDTNGASQIYGHSEGTYGYIMGLTERTLTEDGRVMYRKEVVEYLAQLLQKSLNVPRTFMWYDIQFYSANYVQGDVDGEQFGYYDEVVDGEENPNAMFPRDNAGWLRYQLGVTNQDGSLTGNQGTLGGWEDTQNRADRLLQDRNVIETWTDAAYYMLNTLFMDSAGVNVPEYRYLQLTRETPSSKDGESYYVFDTRYTNVIFDFDKGVISNGSELVHPTQAVKDTTNGSIATYAFLPILRELPEFQGTFPYLKDTGIAEKYDGADSYYNRDYNFTLECHGSFTYYADKNLYFQFDGDDDVYLYVNGRCVLDLGGGHRPANQKIYLNDYVNAGLLDLQDGESYPFDFYFMERHGTGSNLRIMTNMEVIADNIETEKTAEQNGVELPDYSMADFTSPVSYSFSVTNNFDPLGKLTKFSFKDSDIGFYAGFDSVALGEVTPGTARSLSDLKVTVTDSGGSTVYESPAISSADQLMLLLTDPGGRGGLAYGETITLSGVKYTIGEGHSSFSNTVISRAGKHSGVAYHHLLNDTSSSHYFAWKGHELEIPIAEILEGRDGYDTGSWDDIYRCSDSLNAVNTGDVTVDRSNGVVKVNYGSTGTRRLNFTSSTITGVNPYAISVDVHVLDAADSVYVLDFDGNVKLGDTSDNPFFANDINALPGVPTQVRYEAFTDEAPVYTDNRLTLGGAADLWPEDVPATYSVNVNINSSTSTASGQLSQTVRIGSAMSNVIVRPTNPFSDSLSAPTITGTGVTATAVYDRIYVESAGWWLTDTAKTEIAFFNANTNSYSEYIPMTSITGITQWYAEIPSGNITKFMLRRNVSGSYYNPTEHTLDSGYNAYRVEDGVISNVGNYASYRISGTPTSDVTVSFAGAPSSAVIPVRDGGTPALVSAPYYYRNGQQVTTIPESGLSFTNTQGSFTAKLVTTGTGLPLLSFLPGGIMDDAATIYLTSRVYEDKEGVSPSAYLGNVDPRKEVEMFQAITVVPANVVYYEDVNAGIHYNSQTTEGQPTVTWTHGDGATPVSPEQRAEQSAPYGYDIAYATGSGHYSGNSQTAITFRGNVTLADFDFTGTGFDLFSRCEKDGPTVVARIYRFSEEANHSYTEEDLERTVIVATEFSNYNASGSDVMYQVPVVSVHDLTRGKYHVILDGVGRLDMEHWSIVKEGDDYYLISKSDPTERWKILTGYSPVRYQKGDVVTELSPAAKTMTFYLDGLRVYGALSAEDQQSYYNPGEANAAFVEVRDLLTSGRGVAVNYTAGTTDFTTETMTTTVELHNDPNDGFQLTDTGGADLSYYFLVGPNNELYLNGSGSKLQAAVFSLVPEGSGAKTFQIAAKLLDSTSFGSGTAADLRYLTAAGTWQSLGTLQTGMELYYEVDPTLCPQSGGAFTLILATGIDTDSTALVSLTKVKYKGWSFRADYSTETNFVKDENGVIIGITPAGSTQLSNVIRLLAAAPGTLPNPVPAFTDVPENAWYAEAVAWAVENGITAGTSETSFSPNMICTRAQVVTFLWSMAGRPKANSKPAFTDVSEDAWYAEAVAWAAESGVTAGTSATTFSPDEACTRAQVVTFLWSAAGRPKATTQPDFTDVSANAWYAEAVAWAAENGITAGISANTFGSNQSCTRAQIVTFLYRQAEANKGGDLS